MALRHGKRNHTASAELNPNFWPEMDNRGLTPNPNNEEKLLMNLTGITPIHKLGSEYKASGSEGEIYLVTASKFYETVKHIEKTVKYQLFK